MMRAARLSAVVLVPLLALACDAGTEADQANADAAAEIGTASVDLAAEEQAIRARVDAWELAANESAEAFAAFYAPDGVLMTPNAPPMEGPAAVAEGMAPMFAGLESITLEPLQIDVAASGDLAVERGRYTLTLSMPDGSAVNDEGSYLVAWEKQNGQWMVTHDIFNSDLPAPGGDGM